jgi:cation diffusion facilitator family transporter
MSDCDCQFEPRDRQQRRVLRILLAINAVMFLVELAIGLLAESAGVMADSLDMLADAAVYGIGLYAVGRGAGVKQQAARWSGFFQIALAAGVGAEILRKALAGSEPQSGLMMAVAAVALVANAWCLALLRRHRAGEVHMRASWIFTRSDVIANAGVIVAGFLIWLMDTRWPDLIVGTLIAGVVFRGGWEILGGTKRQVSA